VGSFLPTYLEKEVLEVDPFKSIDEDGVGFLISHAIEQGRSVKPDLKVGICGEHGGDPATIDFCYRAGLSYVSCSPFRVPLARLAGAQAVINNSLKGKAKAAAKKAAPKVKAAAAKAKSAVSDAKAKAAPKAKKAASTVKKAAATVKATAAKAKAKAAPKAKAAAAKVKAATTKAKGKVGRPRKAK
jgi:pyruvate,orthophosphate dikinase